MVRKERPAWQKGKLNGPGGKVEDGESLEEAVRREFKEETGVDRDRWSFFCKLEIRENGTSVHFAVSVSETDTWPEWKETTKTDETVFVVRADILESGRLEYGWPIPNRWARTAGEPLYNLPWLVRMAIDHVKNNTVYSVIEESGSRPWA